jgi:carbonic anhydrase
MHGVWMLLFITLLGSMVGLVPLTVLAGLLVFVGAKLVNMHHIQELRRRGELPVYLVTVGGVVGINLLAGIALGLGLAVARLLWKLGRVQVDVARAGDVHQVRVSGALTFVGVPKLSAALDQVPVGAQVELDLAVDTMDHSGYEALASWCQTHHKTGGKVWMEPLEDVWTRKSGITASRSPVALSSPSTTSQSLSSEGAS